MMSTTVILVVIATAIVVATVDAAVDSATNVTAAAFTIEVAASFEIRSAAFVGFAEVVVESTKVVLVWVVDFLSVSLVWSQLDFSS